MTAGACIHGIPWEMGCTLCGTAKPLPASGGNVPLFTRRTRFRVHGRVSPISRRGEQYDVDLIIEPLQEAE